MTTSGLFRLSGTALVLAASLFALAEVISFYIFTKWGEAYDLREIALTEAFFLQSLLTVFAGALLLGGMVGLYVRQSEAARKFGLVGFLLAFLVTTLVVGDFYANTLVTPLVAEEAPAFLDNPLSGILQVWLPFDFVLLGLGWLLLAVATLRAGVYSSGASWVLLVGALLALVPIPLAHLPFHAAMAWVGLQLRRVRDVTPRGRRRSKPRR
jgi:hypothetical protein